MGKTQLGISILVLWLLQFSLIRAQATEGTASGIEALDATMGLANDDRIKTQEYLQLKELLRKDKTSPLRLGIGVAPLLFMNDRLGVGVTPLHFSTKTPDWDIDVLSADVSFSITGGTAKSQGFSLKTSPRFILIPSLFSFSLGPLIGFEYLSFSGIKARLTRGIQFGPTEPYSTSGLIYGISLSQTILKSKDNDYEIKLLENAYKQTYKVATAPADEFGPRFEDAQLQADSDRKPIRATWVFRLDILFCY